MKLPSDAARKNQLFSGRTDEEEEEAGHQFFSTTGWIERFAQLLRITRYNSNLDKGKYRNCTPKIAIFFGLRQAGPIIWR